MFTVSILAKPIINYMYMHLNIYKNIYIPNYRSGQV